MGFLDDPLRRFEFKGKYGFKDKETDRVVVKPRFKEVDFCFSEGLIGVSDGLWWGFMDEKGNIVIKPQFGAANHFSEGYSAVRINKWIFVKRWGFIDKTGKIVIKPQYEFAYSFKGGLAAVKIKDKYGFIDNKGNMVLEPIYEEVRGFDPDALLAPVQIDSRWGFIDKKGKLVVDPQFEHISYSPENGCYEFDTNNKEGLISTDGKIICEPLFDSFHYLVADFWEVELNGKKGILNSSTGLLIDPQFDDVAVESYSEPISFEVFSKGKCLIINESGEIVDEPLFDRVKDFSEGLATIKIDGRWGFIDKHGNVAVRPSFEEVKDFSEGLAAIKIDGRWGFIDRHGKMVIEPIYEDAESFSEGLAAVEVKIGEYQDRWGFIDKTGRMVIEPKFRYIENSFHQGLAVVQDKKRYGIIKKSGDYVIKPDKGYQDIDHIEDSTIFSAQFAGKDCIIDSRGKIILKGSVMLPYVLSDGALRVKIKGKYGFLNEKGQMIIPPQFDDTTRFSEGLAPVKIDELWGFIDKKGKIVIEPQFDCAFIFNERLACVELSGSWGYINKNGEMVVEPKFDSASVFNEGVAFVELDDKWGLINKKGEFVVDKMFDNSGGFSEGLAKVEIDGRSGFIDRTGKMVIELDSIDKKEGITIKKRYIKTGITQTDDLAVGAAKETVVKDAGKEGADIDMLLNEIESMVGLQNVKELIKERVAFLQAQSDRAKLGLPVISGTSLHMVFTGNPGTGKTTVAMKMGKILNALGILKSGHCVTANRSNLVAQYVGQTAPMTKKMIQRAFDGILFVDEAYTLATSSSDYDYGHEAIAQLLEMMENYRDRLVVIVAGYPEEMRNFINSNPGLKSRFTQYINFEDYSPEELLEIFKGLCLTNKCHLSKNAEDKLSKYIKNLYENRDKHFGNARVVRNLFGKVVINQSVRIRKEKDNFRKDPIKGKERGHDSYGMSEEYKTILTTIEPQDVPDCDVPVPVYGRPQKLLQYSEIPKITHPLLKDKSPLDKVSVVVGYVDVETSGGKCSGSGFLITRDGKFVTCHHVIEDAISIKVRFDQRPDKWFTAMYFDGDKSADIAILKLKGSSFPYAELLHFGENIGVGQEVGLLGYPLGAKLNDKQTYTKGVISSFKTRADNVELIQLDVSAYPGNSGGPLFSLTDSKVLGILVSGIEGTESLNFAVRISEIYKRLVGGI